MEFLQTISICEAQQRYFSRLPQRRPPVETVGLQEAAGRVLAEGVASPVDVPDFSKATVDGYAVRAADTRGAGEQTPVVLAVVGRVAMGTEPGAGVNAAPGQAVRIPTGGSIPPGADAVIMQEYTDGGMEEVVIRRPVSAGDGILPRASDIRAGEQLLAAGAVLEPAAIGVLAGIGRVQVGVYRRPAVAIITTGEEIVPPEVEPSPGQVRDMNSPALAAYVSGDGGLPHALGIVGDDRQALSRAVKAAVAHHDMVLVSGGSSVGERDWVPAVVDELGQPGLLVHGIALKPGKPTVLGLVDETPVLGLPGNPVSALVVYLLFGRPVLRHLSGRKRLEGLPAVVRARLARTVRSPAAREEYLRVRLQEEGEGMLAEPLPAASGLLTSMLRADGLLRIPAGTEQLARGQLVEITPLH